MRRMKQLVCGAVALGLIIGGVGSALAWAGHGGGGHGGGGPHGGGAPHGAMGAPHGFVGPHGSVAPHGFVGHRGFVGPHGFVGRRAFVGGAVFVGPGWWWPGWYPAVYSYPVAYAAPAVPQYWYFCPDSRQYFPYTNQCPSGWLRVIPSSVPSSY